MERGARHESGRFMKALVTITESEPRPQGAGGSSISVTYLITFACYGCHLHGQESGSVDRGHNLPGGRLLEPDPKRVSAERRRMDQPPYGLDRARREAVLVSLHERCARHCWRLLAAHVRGNHVVVK